MTKKLYRRVAKVALCQVYRQVRVVQSGKQTTQLLQMCGKVPTVNYNVVQVRVTVLNVSRNGIN